jgi:hypothetical protein
MRTFEARHYPGGLQPLGRFRWVTSYAYADLGASPETLQLAAEIDAQAARMRAQLKRQLSQPTTPENP